MEASIQKIYLLVGALFVNVVGISSVQAALPQIDSNFQFYDTEYFSFQFKNDHSVKRFEDIWYVQNNKTKQTSFVLFERKGKVFHERAFECGRFFDQTEYCYSKTGLGSVVKNLQIKTRSQAFEPFASKGRQAFAFFNGQDVHFPTAKETKMVSRAEALKFILNWNDPGKKYQSYAAACFGDITPQHPYSGEICYAKSQGLVNGIDGKFYPDLGINLWGLLKLLYQNSKIKVPKKFSDWALIEPSVLEGINEYHLALPMVAMAYRNGVLRSELNQSFWPNKVLTQAEFLDIAYRFWRWKHEIVLKSFSTASYPSAPTVIRENRLISYQAKPYKTADTPNTKGLVPQKVWWFQTSFNRLMVYRVSASGVYQYLWSMPVKDSVKRVKLWWKSQKFTGKVQIVLRDGTRKWYKVTPNKKMLAQLPQQNNDEVRQFLSRREWLPNSVQKPQNINIPVVKIFLEPAQFQEMLQNRTTRQRYVGWLDFQADEKSKITRSIRIKTRGNGSLGYIKPSFTVETFKDFPKTFALPFLADGNEFKLRSVLSDESMIREKLWYDVFRKLGLPAPNFTTVLVEINGQPFGVYQLVEPIKKPFFKKRNLSVSDYFYAKNSGSVYNPNLTWLGNPAKTLSPYKIHGDRVKFLDFIRGLSDLKTDMTAEINVKQVLDYAWLTYFLNGWDSVSRNYYVYFDKTKNQWGLFPWDGDESFQTKNLTIDLAKFVYYLRDTTGNFNQLFLYVSHFAAPELMVQRGEQILTLLKSGWVSERIDWYQKSLGKYFEYDNALWNGKALERRKSVYRTNEVIQKLRNLWE